MKNVRIVVADDDDALRGMIADILSDYSVVTARDGLEAMNLVRENAPDLIVLDVSMPGMDGLSVCEHLKRDEATRNIPVLMVTGHGRVSEVERGFEVQADDYIVKPFRPKILEAHVKLLLGGREACES